MFLYFCDIRLAYCMHIHTYISNFQKIFFKLANNTRKNMKRSCKVDGRWEADANALFGKCDVIFVKSFHYKKILKKDWDM